MAILKTIADIIVIILVFVIFFLLMSAGDPWENNYYHRF